MKSVSIIFPMYNVEKYVANSLKSIFDQTFLDFELIAINDGSKDSTMRVFDESVKLYNKHNLDIKIIEKANGGLSDARNEGLVIADCKWVVFVDSDDVLHNRYLETLISDANDNNSDLCIGSYKRVSENNLFDFSKISKGKVISKSELMKLMLSRKKFDAYCGCFLVKKETLLNHNISFNKDVKFSVDQAFMWNLVDVSKKIVINESKIYNYFIRENSIMTSTKTEKIYSAVEHYTKIISSLNNLPFSSSVVIDRWKIGILHSASKIVSYEAFLQTKENLSLDFLDSLKVPLLKVKLFSLMGLISKRVLYLFFRKF